MSKMITHEKVDLLYLVSPDGTQSSLKRQAWTVGAMVTLLWDPERIGTIVKKISKTRVGVLWSEIHENIRGSSDDPEGGTP